jgi:hypothetical protein
MSDSALSPVKAVLAKGKTLAEVLSGLVRPQKQQKMVKVAKATPLTDADKEALSLLPAVYGVVCPTARETLTPQERTLLMQERLIVDVVLGVAERRKEAIKTIICNDFDVTFETDNLVDEMTPVNGEGHYLLMGTHQVPAAGTNHVWSWEVSKGGDPKINEGKLYDLCHTEGSGLNHKDWLAMSYLPDNPRRFDEAKAFDYLKSHPELFEHLEGAMDVPAPRGAIWPRKEKA